MNIQFKIRHILFLAGFLSLAYVFMNMFRTKRLSKEEKAFVPYAVNDELIFASNTSKIDTIKITELDFSKHPPNLLEMFWAKNKEILRVRTDVHCKNCNEIISVATENYTSDVFVSWTIRIHGRNYVLGDYLSSINELELTSLEINGISYDDVIILERGTPFKRPTDEFSKMFYEGIYPIDKLYWSKKHGILQFEIKETNEIWKLQQLFNRS